MPKRNPGNTRLKSWKEIATFLGQPVAIAQRWARSGMPITREGRYTVAVPDELNAWLTRESGSNQPVHIATDNADLSADLKHALSDLRKQRTGGRKRVGKQNKVE
jgi:hypothetical protein